MVDYSELKKLAEACGNLNWRFQQENWTEYAIRDDHGYIATMRVGSPKQAGPDPDREAKAKFLGAMTPAAVLGLIAENDRLSAQVRLAGVAAEMAAHDTAGRAVTEYLVVAQERDQLKTELATERQRRWDGNESAASERDEEVRKLKAEIAGLKIGYAAYEQVNAGLKAEVEVLRLALETCADELEGQVLQCYHGQQVEDMHPVTRRSYDRDMACVTEARAAMGKGGQS